MKQYGYCRAVPGLPGIGEQVSFLKQAGVEVQDIFVDCNGDLSCWPEFSKLKANLTRQDTVVVYGLWSFGATSGEIAQKWDSLTQSVKCRVDVLNCHTLSTAHCRDVDKTIIERVNSAALSQLAYMDSRRGRQGRPPIERPKEFSEVYRLVQERRITNREAMRRLGLKPNTYYKFVCEEKEGSHHEREFDFQRSYGSVDSKPIQSVDATEARSKND